MTTSSPADSIDGRPRGSVKSATAFRTISEVSTELDVPQHVLRFWETKFPQVRPLKRGGGRRYYRPEDVELLRRIQRLLYKEGYTIKGVQRLLRETRGGKVEERPVEVFFDDDLLLDDIVSDAGVEADAPPPAPAVVEELVEKSDDEPVQQGLTAPQRAVIESVLAELIQLRRMLK
ncbi:MAG TPA: MerR family transcriptional regulator [Azospirillaceae bacterium]|nr:MerR family transcriptional regulator [Azospirillaceae bacterium]